MIPYDHVIHSHESNEVQMRLVSHFVNEAIYCLQDDILTRPVSVPYSLMETSEQYIFGLGFPPFLGG